MYFPNGNFKSKLFAEIILFFYFLTQSFTHLIEYPSLASKANVFDIRSFWLYRKIIKG
jgi:hypothetical protein